MGAGEEILKALARIETKLDQVLAGGGKSLAIADDADLDGQYGDPEVKFSPKKWTGDNFKGSHYSACAPDFLDAYAEALQWSSEHPKEGREKYAQYDARDAARARGWARRMRSGWRPAVAPANPVESDAGEPRVPF